MSRSGLPAQGIVALAMLGALLLAPAATASPWRATPLEPSAARSGAQGLAAAADETSAGPLRLATDCAPTSFPRNSSTACSTVVENVGTTRTVGVALSVLASSRLQLGSVTGGAQIGPRIAGAAARLAPRTPPQVHIAAGPGPAGYIPLDLFGISPVPVGDEQLLPFTVPPFVYAGATHTQLAATSNGYLVVGAADAGLDLRPVPSLGNPQRPNGVLAPFWTDLDGTGAPGILATNLTDGVSSWIVVEWRVNVAGTASPRVFQAWIGINGSEDISFAYDPTDLPADPGKPLLVGAENLDGTSGDSISGLPTEDLRVTTDPAIPGGRLTLGYQARGLQPGAATLDAVVVSLALTRPLTLRTSLHGAPLSARSGQAGGSTWSLTSKCVTVAPRSTRKRSSSG